MVHVQAKFCLRYVYDTFTIRLHLTISFMVIDRNRQTTQYRSYLLRLWQEPHEAEWRILLKEINSGAHYSFSSLESMVVFLNEQVSVGQIVQIESDTVPFSEI